MGRCPDNRHLRHLVSIQTGIKGFPPLFLLSARKKAPPLRVILKRSALKVFGTGTYALLYTVICYNVPSFDFLLHKCCKSGVTAKNRLGFVVKIRRFSACDFPRINTASRRPGCGCPPSEDAALPRRFSRSPRTGACRRSRSPSWLSAGDS